MRFLGKKNLRFTMGAGVVAFAVLLSAACGGGGGGGSVFNPMPQAQQPAPTQNDTAHVDLSAAGMKIPLPGVAGFAETLTVPANNAAVGTVLTVKVTSGAPSGMPALAPDMFVAIPYLYFTLGTSKDVTIGGFPGFKLAIPAGFKMGDLPVKVGYYDPIAGWKHIGDFTLVGREATFTPTTTATTLKAGLTYYAITYTCGGPSPTPIPSPASTSVPLSTSTQLPIPTTGGWSGDWMAGSNDAPAGTTVTVTTSLTAPAGAPSPEIVGRHPLFVKPPVNHVFVTTAYSPTEKKAAVASSSFTFNKYPAVSFDLPSTLSTAGLTFKLETFDLTTKALLDTEIGTVSSSAASIVRSTQSVSFPGTNAPFNVIESHTYLWELVTQSSVPEIFVTNYGNSTLTVYDESGDLITTTGAFSGLAGPTEPVWDASDQELYVANNSHNDGPSYINVYDADGNAITTTGTFPNLDNPVGLGLDSNNHHLYASDYFSDVLGGSAMTVYDESGNQISTTTEAFPNLDGPEDVKYDSNNHHLYVANKDNSTVTVYDESGNQISTTGTFPNLNSPVGLAIDSNNHHIYVGNRGNSTVTVYDEEGNQISTTGSFPNLDFPDDVWFDSNNLKLYAANYDNNTVTVYDEEGHQITTSGTFPGLSNPSGISSAP